MNNKEKELVQLSNCYPDNPLSYNLREGGSNCGTKMSTICKEKMIQSNKNAWNNKSDEYKK
jgi:hypothetical protein